MTTKNTAVADTVQNTDRANAMRGYVGYPVWFGCPKSDPKKQLLGKLLGVFEDDGEWFAELDFGKEGRLFAPLNQVRLPGEIASDQHFRVDDTLPQLLSEQNC